MGVNPNKGRIVVEVNAFVFAMVVFLIIHGLVSVSGRKNNEISMSEQVTHVPHKTLILFEFCQEKKKVGDCSFLFSFGLVFNE